MPKVSVIIPNYNHAAFLPRRLESVLNQTYGDFEVIFLDDASTDDSVAVSESYCNDSRLRYVLNEENSGDAFVQWNRGIGEASGEYIWIAESDDFAEARLLETLVGILDTREDVVLAYCQSFLTNENDTDLRIYDDYEAGFDLANWKESYQVAGVAEIRRFLVFGNTIPNASAVVFRRNVFEKVGGAPSAFRLCGDWLTWGRMLLHGDVAFHAEPFNHFRIGRPGTLRAKAKREGLDVTEGFAVFEELSRAINLSAEEFNRAFYWQVERWAMYAIAFRLPLRINRAIFSQFEQVCPDRRLVFALRSLETFARRLAAANAGYCKKKLRQGLKPRPDTMGD